MQYLSIKELSAKFAMPQRTVYYNVANNASIRVKKHWRTKLICVADFAKVCNKDFKPLQNKIEESPKNLLDNSVTILQESLQSLQQENQLDKEKIFSLHKVNTNLETARNRFVQLYTEEKEQRKDLWEKYDSLQQTHHREVQVFLKKYYLALGLCMVCIIMLILLNISQIIGFFQLFR